MLLLASASCVVQSTTPELDLGVAVPLDWQALPAAARRAGELDEMWWTGFDDPGLDAAVVEALARNHDLRAVAARLDAAVAQATIAGADLYPAVNLSLNGGRSRQNFIGLPIPGGALSSTSSSYGVGLNLSWELDLWGRVRSGRAAAVADVAAAAADWHAARLSLVGQTAKAWFAVVAAQRQRRIAEQSLASSRETTVDVRRLYERGARPSLDLHLAELGLASGGAVLEQRDELLQRALRQLELLLGRYPEGRVAPGDRLPESFVAVPAGVPSALLNRRPDLVAAERRLAAAGARTDQANAALYPRISLTASGGTASAELEDLVDRGFRVWSLAGNLLAPLFEGGRLRADVARNEAQQRAAAAEYTSAVLRAFTEVETVLAVASHLQLQERHRQNAAEHARQALVLARDRYRRGIGDFLVVAESQRQSLAQESAWLAARRQRIEARIDLFLALGGGFAPPTTVTVAADEESD